MTAFPRYRMTTEIHPTQTKLVESTLGMRERDFYIDCLRSVMIALVVLHHTAITYGASGGATRASDRILQCLSGGPAGYSQPPRRYC
jgi:hypothetical protein